MYRYVCEECGANLDPGEKCDCVEQQRKEQERYLKQVNEEENGQIRFVYEVVA